MRRAIRKELEKLGERIKRLELEGEKKRREEGKRNVFLREMEIKKEEVERLKEEVKGIVKLRQGWWQK